MAMSDEEAIFGAKRAKARIHEVGEPLDDLSAPELSERIEALRQEIARLEAAITAREATRNAASAFFKG